MYFKDNKIDYVEYNVKADTERRSFMLENYGSMGVPVIVHGKHYMIGWSVEKFNALMAQSADAVASKAKQ